MKKRYYLKEKKRLKREIRKEEKNPIFEPTLLFFTEMIRLRNLEKLRWLERKWKYGKKKLK